MKNNIQISLTLEQCQDVMALLEKAISAIGFQAFEAGGKLMAEIKRQIDDQMIEKQENE